MTSIRDFIYLDVEKLYSLYSQVFEGVADRIIQSHLDGLQSSEQSSSVLVNESDIAMNVLEISRRTENKFLYDYMYSRLENELNPVIANISSLATDELPAKIEDTFLVKIVGNAAIYDFERIQAVTLGKFNYLGEALHYITNFDPAQAREDEKTLEKLQAAVEQTRDKNKKVKAEHDLINAVSSWKASIRDSALQAGLGYDKRFLEYVAELIALYYPERLDVSIASSSDAGAYEVRGVLDKRWLRYTPEFLLSLYSGRARNWTMIGQVTYVSEAESEISSSASHTSPEGLRDAILALIDQNMGLEKHFTLSLGTNEVVISPLAIYRESILNVDLREEIGQVDQDAPSPPNLAST